MNDQINQIRQLLDQLEAGSEVKASSKSLAEFSALELPQIIQEVVDDLQPLLTPYEAAFYWYLFRHSIAGNGSAYLRTGHRRLCKGVAKSSRSGRAENPVAPSKVQEILRELESIGAIRKEGEPNREGTLYRVLVPDEIEACRKYRAERLTENLPPEALEAEIDHYNVRENRVKIFERDQYKCFYCEKQLTRFTATLDHITPVAEGGGNDIGNLITACLHCNSRKQKRPLDDFLAES
jgi:hypothetical protein